MADTSVSSIQTTRFTSAHEIFSSFRQAEHTENPIRPAFGAKELRFDGNIDLKEYFNREPGPGEHTFINNTLSQTIQHESKQVKLRTLIANIKKKDYTSLAPSFLSRQSKFKKHPMNNVTDPNINLGPGHYDAPLAKEV